ncbi:MAG TPA: HAD family hydrolase [Methanoculleus sp.]|jgi:putative hydrolase of the HAD superfamily|uniref:HAD family hydrolase n=1 Tax=Methanoculleus sp. TaxID=90427 RepID=UPI001B684D4C|nr:HAD family hydrolase [Methanoculleus sp.]MBP7144948.1 HAD family hydrolase [Methanoculleus sp.]HNQ32265.1 HAD family hydrolase [Methanoculleus sp.]HNV38092.1 HAD family hydrolase [Methanoculleus sp.]HOC83532.1 HAD family hydrolase [Methanoculleus sp.]HOF96398.1 HAD family hydrolase [Methanoculleus sp.]
MQTTSGTRHNTVEAVICDMDNTLFDFVGAKREACRCVVDYIGAGDPEALFSRFISGTYGFEDHRNIRGYLDDLGVYDPGTFEVCCRTYEDVKLDRIEVYPGVEETLRHLADAGIRLAVATDAELVQARRRLGRTGLIDLFEVVVTPEISGKRKPEPDSLLYALRRLDTAPAAAMMVGDSPVRDIAPGRRLGMVTAFAAYGDWHGNGPADAGADIVLARFSELADHLGIPGR